MYSDRPNLMIGFHGCDEEVRNSLVSEPNKVKSSEEKFDWLGHGFYLWENNYDRALKWAIDKKKRNNSNIIIPSVVGVIYQLNYCLDLTDQKFLELLPYYYEAMKVDLIATSKKLPKNKDVPDNSNQDLVLRELDCAVINFMNKKIDAEIEKQISSHKYSTINSFDSIRGIFTEGDAIYDGAGIKEKNHIQVCIRNLNCIKGFFIPRKKVE